MICSSDEALQNGWIERQMPRDERGNSCSGFIRDVITPAGMDALAQENARLGDAATRLVHSVRYFGHLKPVRYGHPREVSMKTKIVKIDGAPCVDDGWRMGNLGPRTGGFWQWLFG